MISVKVTKAKQTRDEVQDGRDHNGGYGDTGAGCSAAIGYGAGHRMRHSD